jgi:hypothetical protein
MPLAARRIAGIRTARRSRSGTTTPSDATVRSATRTGRAMEHAPSVISSAVVA